MAKQSLKERLKAKQQELKSRAQSGAIVYQKPDTTIRIRILNMGEEEEFIKEVTQYYLGSEIKGVISPSTFGEPCAIAEGHDELKNSEDDSDRDIANKFSPKKRYLALCAFYKDLKGQDLDTENSPKFILLTTGSYQDILELYLDDDEWGDMTDPEEGYDLKIKRTGSGKMDTEYTVNPCRHTKAPKGFTKVYNLDEEVKKILPSYEETQRLINQYLGIASSDDDEEEPKKKTTGRASSGTKKVIKKKVIRKKGSDV